MRKKLQDSKLIGRKHEFASFLHSEGCVQTIRDFWWAEWHWIRFVVGRVALDQICGGQSGTGSDLWWAEWHWIRFFYKSHTLWTSSVIVH